MPIRHVIFLLGAVGLLVLGAWVFSGGLNNPQARQQRETRVAEILTQNIQQGFTTLSGENSQPQTRVERASSFLVTEDDPALGNPNAPLVIVEFIDFECPFCLRSFPIMRKLAARYADVIYYQVRDFPLVSIHPNAMQMARAGVCAHQQEKFWELHDRMFLEQSNASDEQIQVWARSVGLNMGTFNACLHSPQTQAEISEDVEVGQIAGARGTPTFFINGQKFEGVISEQTFEQIIAALEL